MDLLQGLDSLLRKQKKCIQFLLSSYDIDDGGGGGGGLTFVKLQARAKSMFRFQTSSM